MSDDEIICALLAERDRYLDALLDARDELGVPGPGYPAPVANAVAVINEALNGVAGKR